MTSKAEYQRGIMDAFHEPGVEGVVVMSSAQVGKTEILNNVLGYFIDLDPAPILVVQPDLTMAHEWSKDRFGPMIRDTPVLRDKVAKEKSRDANNTILHKNFIGGNLTIVTANSPSGLAGRPKRILLVDEIDRYKPSSGQEGDPFNLALKRLTAFWNKRWGVFSTPSIKGASRIESLYDSSDKRRYFVPCPLCGKSQYLKWGQLNYKDFTEPLYVCEHCQKGFPHKQKRPMILNGNWIATAEFKGVAGFHLNELYSPWVTWSQMVDAWHEAIKGGRETLKTFINTSLGETFEEEGESIDDVALMRRREPYTSPPEGAAILTAGVDVQDDRLEVEVVGWGYGHESWSVDYQIFYGDPGKDELWRRLSELLATDYEGQTIASAAIDSGGHYTDAVYKYAALRWGTGVYAIRGHSDGWGKPLVGRPSNNNKWRCRVFTCSVDEGKRQLYNWLRLTEPGPGYCHFSMDRDEEFFAQLTAETMRRKLVKGFPRYYWEKTRPRNEAIDCRTYARMALQLHAPDLDRYIQERETGPKKSQWFNKEKRRRR